ncbi:hypothetical protein C8J57DRAFT_1708829 [Mycena rebaudengoi]|nr:hypothetical protein C8J57DRAFT_1708829 [Mycena rebaudengoi]
MVNDDVDVLDYGDSPPPEDEPASAVAVTPVIPVPAPAASAPPPSLTPTTVPSKVEARASTAKHSTARKASSSAVLDLASSSKDGPNTTIATCPHHRRALKILLLSTQLCILHHGLCSIFHFLSAACVSANAVRGMRRLNLLEPSNVSGLIGCVSKESTSATSSTPLPDPPTHLEPAILKLDRIFTHWYAAGRRCLYTAIASRTLQINEASAPKTSGPAVSFLTLLPLATPSSFPRPTLPPSFVHRSSPLPLGRRLLTLEPRIQRASLSDAPGAVVRRGWATTSRRTREVCIAARSGGPRRAGISARRIVNPSSSALLTSLFHPTRPSFPPYITASLPFNSTQRANLPSAVPLPALLLALPHLRHLDLPAQLPPALAALMLRGLGGAYVAGLAGALMTVGPRVRDVPKVQSADAGNTLPTTKAETVRPATAAYVLPALADGPATSAAPTAAPALAPAGTPAPTGVPGVAPGSAALTSRVATPTSPSRTSATSTSLRASSPPPSRARGSCRRSPR